MYTYELDFKYTFDVSDVFDEFIKVKFTVPKIVRKYVKFDLEKGLKES